MTEKEQIEKHTAEAFIALYNKLMNTDYRIVEMSDAPDVKAKNSNGNMFNFDITLTEDRPGDIKAILGRSEDKSLEALKEHMKKVKEGKASIFESSSSLSGNVASLAVSRIKKKLTKRYGSRTGLVLRYASRVGWDWEYAIEDIRKEISKLDSPFDMGIWLINNDKTKIFRIV